MEIRRRYSRSFSLARWTRWKRDWQVRREPVPGSPTVSTRNIHACFNYVTLRTSRRTAVCFRVARRFEVRYAPRDHRGLFREDVYSISEPRFRPPTLSKREIIGWNVRRGNFASYRVMSPRGDVGCESLVQARVYFRRVPLIFLFNLSLCSWITRAITCGASIYRPIRGVINRVAYLEVVPLFTDVNNSVVCWRRLYYLSRLLRNDVCDNDYNELIRLGDYWLSQTDYYDNIWALSC